MVPLPQLLTLGTSCLYRFISTMDGDAPHLTTSLLAAAPLCPLSNPQRFIFTVRVTNRDPDHRPVTILAHDTILDSSTSPLSQGRIEIVESEPRDHDNFWQPLPVWFTTGNVGNVHCRRADGGTNTPGDIQQTWDFDNTFVTLRYGERNQCEHVLTTPSEAGVSAAIDTVCLETGRSYRLRLKDHGIWWWRYGTKEEILQPKGTSAPLDTTPQLPPTVGVDGARFRVIEDLPYPPAISVSLAASSDVCRLSGSPLFIVTATVTYHGVQSVTVLSGFNVLDPEFDLKDFDIFDSETGVPIRWDEIAICRGSARYWNDFSTLEPNRSYRNQVTFSAAQTNSLQHGRSYVFRLRPCDIWWSYQAKDRIVGPENESGVNLRYVPPIRLACSDEVRFRAE